MRANSGCSKKIDNLSFAANILPGGSIGDRHDSQIFSSGKTNQTKLVTVLLTNSTFTLSQSRHEHTALIETELALRVLLKMTNRVH